MRKVPSKGENTHEAIRPQPPADLPLASPLETVCRADGMQPVQKDRL